MTSRETVREQLLRPEQMGQIGPREPPAGEARAVRPGSGAGSSRKRGVADVEPAARDPQLAVPGDPRRQHRVEQVDARGGRPRAGPPASRGPSGSAAAGRRRGAGPRRRASRRAAPAVSSPASPPRQIPSNGRRAMNRVDSARRSGSRPPWTIPNSAWSGAGVGGERALRPAMGPLASRRRRPPAASSGRPAGRRRPRCPTPSASWTRDRDAPA